MSLPDFTEEQRKRLARFGVLPEQIEQLRHALIAVILARRPPARRNTTKKVMADVIKHADALACLLVNMSNQKDSAHSAAMIEIEQRYWKARPSDEGASSAHNIIPRLVTLADAARNAIESMPSDQARHRTGSGTPIRWIDEALLRGWVAAQGPREARIIDGKAYHAALPPYPDKFHAHESENFVEIATVCYEAAGAPRDFEPLAAIRAYIQGKKRQRDEDMAAFDAALDTSPASNRKPRQGAKRGNHQ